MSSSIVVNVCKIEKIRIHSNADNLYLASIKGWQTVIRKMEDGTPQFNEGDLVVYIPPDSVVPKEMADRLGILNYLSEKTDMDGNRVLVVKKIQLRGEPSFGLAIQCDRLSWKEGDDVREYYGIEKYNPPVKFSCEDAESPHSLFDKYTGIENYRNFPDVFYEGEELVVSEKLHGTNARAAYIDGQFVFGSHAVQRRFPGEYNLSASIYWHPYTIPSVRNLLVSLGANHKQVILFGEIYGARIQKLTYGKLNSLGFRAFDLMLDGVYQDFYTFNNYCSVFGIETVPILGVGKYTKDKIIELSKGNTTMPEATHIREGVVIKPLYERKDSKIGRVILKYINDAYLFSKSKEEDTTDY